MPVFTHGEACLDCHDDPVGEFSGTPHEGFDCSDCHAGLDEDDLPHADPMPVVVVACLDCHEEVVTGHGFHPDFMSLGVEAIENPGNNCVDCHGAHTIWSKGDEKYPFSLARQTSRCGTCHELESIGYLHSAHARALEDGIFSSPTCLGCHESYQLLGENECKVIPHKVRVAKLCMSCHVDDPEVAGQTIYGSPFMTSFKDSVHGKALFECNPNAPSCVDCHGSHEVARGADQYSHVSRGQVVSQCSQCHKSAAEDYLHSIHAKSSSRGNRDAPVCTDCHGEHNILAHSDPDSPVAQANMAEQVCGECHGSYKLTERYGLDSNKLKTFKESFHGLAARGGAVEVVNCGSCHGYHDVRQSDDPESLVHPDKLAKTCGSCHEGANERFATGKVHVSIDTSSEEPIVYWVAVIYTWGIVLIIGGMFLHNFLDFFHKVRMKATSHWTPHRPLPDGAPHRLYLRMSLNERIQHAILAVSFIVLVVSGFMLRYPDAWWVEALRDLSRHAFDYRGLVHRIAGIIMCLAGAWHFYYVSFTPRGRRLIRDLFPCVQDLKDMVGILKYNLGLSRKRPLFARFSYMEKAEYWALIWGSILMTVTGFLLWYENVTIGLLTKLGFDISLTIHFYEAILATLAIIVWHIYWVIFNPDVYPMNLSWLTGRMSEEEMETEHPLELERIKREEVRGKID
ncbi:cytochrome B [Puniceicoccales bacterium CK1056]|uniref:Cytochrome B n=1 Tax=Oceanipulchritudo coccoides TaxID=2706888 RepID=A0A6B2M387_9BACT|nr:cytochrome b/b6 domain-containing protein [Oceanipulchritudo coccoides]NDV62876.1 cytochrome B [Oceanipulchritudo coccoides]